MPNPLNSKFENEDINKKLSRADLLIYKEIIKVSSYLFHVMDIDGAIGILFKDNSKEIHHCLTYAYLDIGTIPIFITYTLKELRDRLVCFKEFTALFNLNGLNDLERFIDELSGYSAALMLDFEASCLKIQSHTAEI